MSIDFAVVMHVCVLEHMTQCRLSVSLNTNPELVCLSVCCCTTALSAYLIVCTLMSSLTLSPKQKSCIMLGKCSRVHCLGLRVDIRIRPLSRCTDFRCPSSHDYLSANMFSLLLSMCVYLSVSQCWHTAILLRWFTTTAAQTTPSPPYSPSVQRCPCRSGWRAPVRAQMPARWRT